MLVKSKLACLVDDGDQQFALAHDFPKQFGYVVFHTNLNLRLLIK